MELNSDPNRISSQAKKLSAVHTFIVFCTKYKIRKKGWHVVCLRPWLLASVFASKAYIPGVTDRLPFRGSSQHHLPLFMGRLLRNPSRQLKRGVSSERQTGISDAAKSGAGVPIKPRLIPFYLSTHHWAAEWEGGGMGLHTTLYVYTCVMKGKMGGGGAIQLSERDMGREVSASPHCLPKHP